MKRLAGMDGRKTPKQEFLLIDGEAERRWEKQGPLRGDKKALVLRKGVLPMEQSIASQMWKSRDGTSVEIVGGEFSYDVIWLLLALARKAVTEKRELGLVAVGKKEEPAGLVPMLEVTDGYIQGALDKPRFSSEQINRSMRKLPLIMMDIKDRAEARTDDQDGVTEHELTYERVRPVFLLDVLTHRKTKRGKGARTNTERIYRVYFPSLFGARFLDSLWEDGFSFIPVRTLAHPVLEQRIAFATCRFSGEAIISERQMLRICHLKESGKKHRRYMQRREVMDGLDSLRKDGLKGVCWFDRKKRVYHVRGPRARPRPPGRE